MTLLRDPLFSAIIVALLFSAVLFLMTMSVLRSFRTFVGRHVNVNPRVDVGAWPRLQESPPGRARDALQWAGIQPALVGRVCMGGFLLAAFFAFALRSFTPFIVLMIGGIAAAFFVILRVRRQRRRFTASMPDAIDALVQALRAGYALSAALAIVGRETQEPTRSVFSALARAEQYRVDFWDAVRMLDIQLRSQEWSLVSEALGAQRETGGNIIPLLTQVAVSIREKVRIDHEVSAATAPGRLSGMIVALLAPASFVVFSIIAPEYIHILVTTTLGKMLLGIAALLELLGFFFIARIVRVEY